MTIMIEQKIFYGLKCDRCGTMCEGGEFEYFDDESFAVENALESEWKEIGDKHYCPDCYEIDEETDEVKVYEPYPDYIDKVMSFIKGGLKVGAILKETKDKFTITVFSYNVLKFKEYDLEYIKNVLGDKLISSGVSYSKYGTLQNIFEVSK